jgi:hypothetical protein
MVQPLFIEPELYIEKTAGEVDLPEDPNVWPKEVLDELYKQVPYIADFQPHVVMSKVDGERGYGMGHVEIANQSEAQAGTDPQQMQAAGIRSVRIPVVIKDGKLSPFDLIVNDASKCVPLTEARLRQSLFRPQAFDITSKTPGDHSLIGSLYPPFRQNFGGGTGGGIVMPGDTMGKMSSVEKTASAFEEYLVKELEKQDDGFRKPKVKTAAAIPQVKWKTGSVLEAIAPSIGETELNSFWTKLAANRGLQAAFRQNGEATAGSLNVLANTVPVGAEKIASLLPQLIRPDVVQLSKAVGGYRIKTANAACWLPMSEGIDRQGVVRRFGEKIALDLDVAGAVTIADGCDAYEEQVKTAEYMPVSEAGFYKVHDEAGKEIVGFVIPNLIDSDGESVPLSLFTNGSQATVQAEIFGEPAGDGANLPTTTPGGYGAFFEVTNEGEIRATIPMTLQGSYAGEDGVSTISGETYDGRPVEVSIQPTIQEPMGTPEGKLLLPQSWQWMPLGDAEQVALAGGDGDGQGNGQGEPEMSEEEVKESEAYVTVRSGGGTFSFDGPAVEKLAAADRGFLDLDDAMFLLAGLGVHQGYGATKLAHALTGDRPERIKIGRWIKPAAEARAESLERAKEAMAQMPDLKRDLVKEAAFIPDPTAVDTVLSVGFINPENLMTFVSYLPQIDDSQAKLCELLLAARLGIKDISSTALERAVRSVEEVIEGLKVIAFQGM